MRDVHATVLIGDVSGIPDDLAAVTGWFQDVPAGGPTGAELPRKLLDTIGDTLSPVAASTCRRARCRDERDPAAARRVFGDNIEPVLERTFPLPDLVAKSDRHRAPHEGRTAEAAPARQPAALGAPGLALRPRLTHPSNALVTLALSRQPDRPTSSAAPMGRSSSP
jgi:hypothetical protein